MKAVCARTRTQLRGSIGYHPPETPINQGRSQREPGGQVPQKFYFAPQIILVER